MTDFDDVKEDLERMRDEIKLKMHLANMDMKEEWGGLEQKFEHFTAQTRARESAAGVGHAVDQLGNELKKAYLRFQNALKD